jgi:hypothetical protein
MTTPFFIATRIPVSNLEHGAEKCEAVCSDKQTRCPGIMLSDCEPFRQMAIVCRRRKSPGPGRTRNGRLSISVYLTLAAGNTI